MKRFGNISPTTQSDSDESVSSGGRSRESTQTEDSANITTASRAELMRYVEALSKQSGTYERRFKDMVRAYKHLQTERDTLETSLKASLAQRSLPGAPETGGEEGGLSDEVSVLTQAVATLREEKSRIESQYQEDKKQSSQEQKSQRRTLTDNLEQAEKDLGDLLRERQGLKEEVVRLKSENCQLSLETGTLRVKTADLERQLSERDETRYLQQILSLQRQVAEWSESGRVSELKGDETDRVLREQRGTIGELELKLSKLESELNQANKRRDDTAADLEARVSELSGIVGRYQEQVLFQDREISELRQTSFSPQPADTPDHMGTVIELRDKNALLHSTLQTVLRQVLVVDRIGADEACAMNISELLSLLGRERVVTSPLPPPETDSDKLCEEYKRRLEETEGLLRGREAQLMGELSWERQEGQRRAQEFEKETERKEAENRSRIGQAESQLIRLREHTVSLLADKDSEICRLKPRHPALPSRDQQTTDSAFNQLISVSGYYSDSSNRSLHLSQTKLREKEKLRSALERSEELESAVRDSESRELKHLEQLSFLQNEINRLDNSLARQGTNLEYLKNVVLQFVTGPGGKKRELFVPLATVLKLTADESRILANSINPKW